MSLRTTSLTFCLVLFVSVAALAAPFDNDTQARVHFDTKQQAYSLLTAGLDIVSTTDTSFDIFANPGEIRDLQAQSYRVETIHESVSEFYRSRLPRSATALDMGGYKTLSEIEAAMDDLAAAHPDLVTPKMSIGTTHEGRDIWAMKISDNPNVDEDEPEVLFTAAIHCREVITPELLLQYMNWLTSNYGVDSEATELVNDREIWFVPVVNPDGYHYNQVIAPGGGGLWRKNRRNNGDGSYGVDLNRNFGTGWGYDNAGSSPITGSETYRGPSAFSEPETQAMRDFELGRHFSVSCYYHSYSDLFLNPWGYAPILTPDDDIYMAMGDTVHNMNGYTAGAAWQVLYLANGGSFDWEYAEQTLKEKTFGVTIEIGNDYDGFWPPLGRVPTLIAENMGPIKFLTRLAGHVNQLRPPLAPAVSVPAQVDGSGYSVSWSDTDPDNPGVTYDVRELRHPYLADDRGESLTGWNTNEWTVSTARSYSPPSSLYSGSHDSTTSYIQTAFPYEVHSGDTLRFMTWYDLEFYYDFAYFEVSTDGRSFESIPGSITTNYNPHGGNLGNGITGSSGEWIPAAFDLSAYAGEKVWIRISYQTDFATHGEGMYIDDLYPHLLFDNDSLLASSTTEHVISLTDRPIGAYYYRVRATDAENQVGQYSAPVGTDVLAADKGDPDLDGIKGSVGDVALLQLYFLEGLTAFDVYEAQQIAESDFNCDDLTLTAADLTAATDAAVGAADPCYSSTAAPSVKPEWSDGEQALSASSTATAPSYTVALQVTAFPTGDTAWADIVLLSGDSSLIGFQFHVEYDTVGLSLAAVRLGDNLSGWQSLAHYEEVAGSTADARLLGLAYTSDPGPSPEDLDPSQGPLTLARLVFNIDSDTSFISDIRFAWDGCGDNVLALGGYQGPIIGYERLALSRTVRDADLVDITGSDPLFGGADYTCAFGLFGPEPIAAVDFTNGRLSYDASCCVGHTGDADGSGDDEPSIGDISALVDYLFISGENNFVCLQEADVNQSGGENPTVADLTIGDISLLIDHLFITQAELPTCL